MLKVGNKYIEDDMWSIVKKLKHYLAENGITRFNDMQNQGSYIMCTCPNSNHKSGQERNPSCGILKRDEGERLQGWVHCFACGYTMSFDEMISDVMGVNDDGEFGRKWLLDNFINILGNERTFSLDLNRDTHKDKIYYISDEELDKYRYSHPYWAKRKIDEETCIRFDLGYDKETNSITMPCWDYQGRCIGVSLRAVDRKSFHLPKGVTKPIYLFNYAIKEGWKEIYLCESQINALYLNSLGYNACACFGTGSLQQAQDIVRYGIRSVVFCFDGDSAGRKGMQRMFDKIQNKVLCSYIEVPEGKDVNDLSAEEINLLIKNKKSMFLTNFKNFQKKIKK